MSATPRICPRCGALLLTTPGGPTARCTVCGARYRLTRGGGKAGPTSARRAPAPAGSTRTASPPEPGVLVGTPYRPKTRAAAVPAPVPPTTSRYKAQRPRFSPRFVAGVVVAVLLAGVGLAAALILSGDGPERPAVGQRTARPTGTAKPGVRNPGAVKPAARPGPAEPTNPVPATPTPSPAAKSPAPTPAPAPRVPEQAIYQADATAAPAGGPAPGSGRIDELVFGKLREKGITPAAPCSDAVFLRRAYLDVIGTLPTAEEARAFLKDTDPNKRRALIDRLLQRGEFADYWAMKWSDLLRVKSEFPINLWPNAVRSYHHWIRAAVREDVPYDRFARALLTSSGSNFREPPVNFFRALQGRAPKTAAQAVGLTFLGIRPEGLPAERWEGMAAFYSQIGYKSTGEWKEEIVYFDPRKPLTPAEAVFPDGTKASLQPGQDPRFAFADWLITPQNPWFTKNIANRVWSWLLGRGIIHEPDDVRPDNPPSHPELLAYLEQELIGARYDLKHLFRLILNSRTYQLSCVATDDRPEAAALFASYPVRRLDAEVLIDAVCQITGTSERYYSPIPEPFTYLPQGHRAVCVPDASITSPFLEMFGRPPRDTGLESERNNNFTAAQRLHLLNSSHIMKKIQQGPGLAGLLRSGRDPQETAEELYLTILSRFPSPEEREVIRDHAPSGDWGRGRMVDIAWALINSAEFLCRH